MGSPGEGIVVFLFIWNDMYHGISFLLLVYSRRFFLRDNTLDFTIVLYLHLGHIAEEILVVILYIVTFGKFETRTLSVYLNFNMFHKLHILKRIFLFQLHSSF